MLPVHLRELHIELFRGLIAMTRPLSFADQLPIAIFLLAVSTLALVSLGAPRDDASASLVLAAAIGEPGEAAME